MFIRVILIGLLYFNISVAQTFEITPDMYKFSPNSITGIYLCTPKHVLDGDCSDVDKEYYDNLARITLGGYEIGILYVNKEKTIAFKGAFSPGSAERLITIFKKYPDVKTLTLSSQGGADGEVYKIVEYIKANNLKTWVPVRRMCLSACAIVFLSGNEKTLDGQLGLHIGEFFIEDPFLVRNLDATKSTIKTAIYESNIYLMRRVRLFLEWGISLSLLDAVIEEKGNMLVFTSLDEIFNFNSLTDAKGYIRSHEEIIKYAKDQPAKNFDFQKYEPL